MLGTYLLHQVDALHCLELLSIDEEHRASGLRVKVMFQRKHPSIQSHSTPGTGPDIWNCLAEAVRAAGEEVEIFLQWGKGSESQEGTRVHTLQLGSWIETTFTCRQRSF